MSGEKLLAQLQKHLVFCGQPHLLEGLDTLTSEQVENFSKQVAPLSLELLHTQREALFAKPEHDVLEPWVEASEERDGSYGKDLLAKGKVACVILAGGQGSRLGWHGPKALFPIIPEKNLTLLQILVEKVCKTSDQYGYSLPVAVMASPLNIEALEEHARSHNWYGLAPGQLAFFTQGMLPLLTVDGNWFLERPGSIAMGPDGNGGVFVHLQKSGILKRWKELGIEAVTVLPIDNPLALPFDEHLIGCHYKHDADAAVKCIERIDPEEKIGVFAKHKDRLHVIEYSEMSSEGKKATDPSGQLLWPYANINLFSFSLSFIERILHVSLPWHIAHKKAVSWQCGEIPVAKCETFLFDVLPLAQHPKLLLYPRESFYAPLKNKEGEKSPMTVRAVLEAR